MSNIEKEAEVEIKLFLMLVKDSRDQIISRRKEIKVDRTGIEDRLLDQIKMSNLNRVLIKQSKLKTLLGKKLNTFL